MNLGSVIECLQLLSKLFLFCLCFSFLFFSLVNRVLFYFLQALRRMTGQKTDAGTPPTSVRSGGQRTSLNPGGSPGPTRSNGPGPPAFHEKRGQLVSLTSEGRTASRTHATQVRFMELVFLKLHCVGILFSRRRKFLVPF